MQTEKKVLELAHVMIIIIARQLMHNTTNFKSSTGFRKTSTLYVPHDER